MKEKKNVNFVAINLTKNDKSVNRIKGLQYEKEKNLKQQYFSRCCFLK